ncbi:MAG: aminotransferase class V-fold PLP-dependent enzyme [Verrucomicrobiae bacterium]|nr:aminotransferase class V-fold PLP-dependent enzyme [Verrucomicrobiae bacterium]
MLTPETRRADFPSIEGKAYLNTAAEGIPPLPAREALNHYFEHKSLGMECRDHLFAEYDTCRQRAANVLGFEEEEIAFCSSSSEAYNLLATAIAPESADEIVITDLEFPAGATPWLSLPGNPTVHLWKNRDGMLELDDLAALLSERTRLVQVSLVSFLTGYRIPWAPLRDLVRERAPQAILSVDVTQAAGRIVLDCQDADCLIGSTYKWLLGTHGGAVVAVPRTSSEKVTARAGGWYHLVNAFDADRFTRVEPKPGADSFAVGMPSFPAIYALSASLDYLDSIGIEAIAAHADPIVARLHEGLAELGIKTMSPFQPDASSGIVSFQHQRDEEIHAALLAENIHVMHQAGRLRISIHGYNQADDIDRLLGSLRSTLR